MSLDGAGQAIQVASACMGRKTLPFWQRLLRGLNCRINVSGGALRDLCDLLACGGIGRVKKHAMGRLPPRAVNEMAELSSMSVEPGQRFLRVLRRWTVFHPDELFSYAHWLLRFL